MPQKYVYFLKTIFQILSFIQKYLLSLSSMYVYTMTNIPAQVKRPLLHGC